MVAAGLVDAQIEENAFKIILLLRLSPVFRFNLINYALGLTRARTWDFVLVSFLGMLPGTFLYVYLGSLVTSAGAWLTRNEASSGMAGLITAIGSAGLGAKVALVERHLMGGDCLNYGCVPSNALIRASYHLCSMLRSGLSQRGTSDCVSRPS
jgi:hypothetical protein